MKTNFRLPYFKGVVLFMALFIGYPTWIVSYSNVLSTVSIPIVSGSVVDDNGTPMPGVTVAIKGTTKGTITDLDGKFQLKGVAKGDVVEISFIGMNTQDIVYKGQESMQVKLRPDVKAIDEVVVVGFGTQKKENLTGAVATVDTKVLESRPVPNVSQSLQGSVPGLNITAGGSGGNLDAEMNINIRGTTTLGDGSNGSPLILIDGTPGDINTLNPQDIESISVLKDAASSAIYGSRAPFGVILVTTKSGTKGKPKVSYTNNFRFSSPLNEPKLLDSYNFALYFNEAAKNSGEVPVFDTETLQRIKDYQEGKITTETVANANGDRWESYQKGNANTDWYDVAYKNVSFSQEHALSVSGGVDKVDYFISGNYMNQHGLLKPAKDVFDRITLNMKLDVDLAKWIKVGYNIKFMREKYTRPSYMTDLFYHNLSRKWPTCPVTDPNGYYMESSEMIQITEGGDDKNVKDWIYNNLSIKLTPFNNFTITAELNNKIYNMYDHWDVLSVSAHDVNGDSYLIGWDESYPAGQTKVSETSEKEDYIASNIYVDYLYQSNLNTLKVMAGFQAELDNYRNMDVSRENLITNEVPTINTATGATYGNGGYHDWSTAGFFGRINYNYAEKYLAEFNLRYDGTSRFLRDQRWNLFPSFSLGWNVAKELFFEKYSNIVNQLKFRGSWGSLGNQNTQSYYPFYVSQPIGIQNGGWLIDGEKTNTASAPGIVSETLSWENIQSWNVGVDVALLNNRLTSTFDYFQRKTLDMVGPGEELPVILGTGVPKTNNADLKTYGFEFQIGWRDQISSFQYGVKFMLSDDQAKILKYPNETKNIGRYLKGQKLDEIWGYTTHGIAKSDKEMNEWMRKVDQNPMGKEWAAGDIMYEDINHDGKIDNGSDQIDNPGDKSIIGNSHIRFQYSIDADCAWKGFDFRIFFQGVGKRDLMLGGNYFWGASGGLWQSTGFEEHLDFFRPQGHPMGANLDGYYPRPNWNDSKNQQTQTRYIQSAAYLRLKNIQLGYTLPSYLSKKIGSNRVRIYFSGDNVATWTQLSKMFDPETAGIGGWGAGKSYPLNRTLSIGLNANF